MKTIELNIYKFDELSPEIQNRVIEKHRFSNTEIIDWWDCTYEDWYEKLREQGFTSCKIYFSGFASQGDGACFDCDDFDIEKLMKGFDYNPIEAEVIRMVSPFANIVKNSFASHYSHYKTRYFELAYDGDISESIQALLNISPRDLPLRDIDEFEDFRDLYELLVKYPDLKRPNVSELIKSFESGVEEIRANLCKQIYRDLEREYYSLISDESVRDYLSESDMEFTERGEVWN